MKIILWRAWGIPDYGVVRLFLYLIPTKCHRDSTTGIWLQINKNKTCVSNAVIKFLKAITTNTKRGIYSLLFWMYQLQSCPYIDPLICLVNAIKMLDVFWKKIYRKISNIRRCSNHIIFNLTHGFNRLGKYNCKTRGETLKFWQPVRFIYEIWRYMKSIFIG